jgi:hypothetical protein
MANVQTAIKRLEFIINEEETICNLYYTSSQPENIFWGGGWQNKSFKKGISVIDFIKDEVPNHLNWDKGMKSE